MNDPFAHLDAPPEQVKDPFAHLDADSAAVVDPFAHLDAEPPTDPFAHLDAPEPSAKEEPGAIRQGMRSVASALSTYLFPYPKPQISAPAEPQPQQSMGSFVRGVANVEQAGRVALLNAGLMSPEAVAQLEQQSAAKQAYYPAKPREERGLLEHVGTLAGENIPNAVVSGVAALLGGVPALAAAGFGVEGASSLAQRMQESGVDLQNAEQVRAFMADPAKVADARKYAATRGAVVAGVDAASAGLARGAGRALFGQAGRGATGAVVGSLGAEGVELAGGGAGEALAQVATDGGVTDWNAVTDEVLGGIATGAATQAGLLTRDGRAAAAQQLGPRGATVIQMPAMTPEYLARQQQLSNAGAAPGGVSPAAGQPTAGSPAGAAPAPSDMFSDLDGLDRVDRTDVSGAAAGGMSGPVTAGAPAAGGQAPQGRTAGAAGTGLTPMSRPAGASVPVSQDAEKQISEAISTRKGFPVRKGSSVDVLRLNRNNGAETLKAKIIGIVDENTVRVEYTGLTYAQKKLKLPTEVDVGSITEPANVAAMRRRARILGELPPEERRQVVADSRAFNDLLEQSPGLYDVQTAMRLGDLPNPREAAMRRSQLRRDALAVAKRELGLPEDADMSNPVWQARALPLLQNWMQQQEAAANVSSSAPNVTSSPANVSSSPIGAGFSPSGQGQLIGQDEGGFTLTGEQVQPGGPSMDELEAARRAQEEHLKNMGQLFDDPPPEPTSSDDDVPFSGAFAGADQVEKQPGRPTAPPPPPGAPAPRGMDDVRLPFSGPELLKLWRGMGGLTPKVFERLAGGRARGLFRGLADGQGAIELDASLGRMVGDKERADLLSEARDEAQAEQDAIIAAGGTPMTPVQQAALETRFYQERLKLREDWALVNRGQEQFAKTFAHEIGHAEKWFAGIPSTMNYGNLLGQIASMVGYAKKTLAEHPSMPDLWMTKQMRAAIRRQAERDAGPKPPKSRAAELEIWKRQVKQNFAYLLDDEAANRGFLQLKDAQAEMIPLVKWWRGVQTLTPYHLQPREMYADLMSMFLMAPGQLEARAPKTFYVLDQWIQTNRAFYKTYKEIQKRIATGANLDDRTREQRDMMARSDDRKALRVEARDRLTMEEVKDAFIVLLDRVRGPIYRRMRQLKEMDPDRYERMRDALKSDVYTSSMQAARVAEANAFAVERLGRHGWTWDDFGEYSFHKRVIWERANLINPNATDSVASLKRLEEWKAATDPVKWQALEDAHAAWQDQHKRVLDEVDNLGVVDPQVMDYMMKNEVYATFDVVRDEVLPGKGTIGEMLLSSRAPTPGSAIRKQKGTLQDITNPATATLEKQLSLLAWAHKQRAKRETAELLRDFFPSEIEPAKVAFIDGRAQPVRREGARVGTLQYKQGGRDVAFYVPKGIAAAFDRGSDGPLGVGLSAARMVSGTFQALLTAWNPLAWPTLATKDVLATVSRVPKSTLWLGERAIVKKLARGYKAAHSFHFGTPNQDARRALSRGMLQGVRDSGLADRDDVGIQKLMREFGQNPMGAPSPNNLRGMLARFNRMGQTFEHAVKIAGMLWVDEFMPKASEARKRQLVRVNVGSPEFMDRGLLAPFLNLKMPFFNAAKQGWIAQVQSAEAFDSKLQYAGRLAAYAILPRIAIRLLQGGIVYATAKALGWDDEEAEKERKAMWSAIPERDRMLYLCIPTGWYDRQKNKVAYLRIPQDETSALIGGMFEKGIFDQNDMPGTSDVAAFLASRFEAGDNNLLTLAGDWLRVYVKGELPVDDFTKRTIIPEKYATAGGGYRAGAMLKHSYNQMPEQFRMIASILPGVPGRFDLTDRPEQKRGLLEEFSRTPGIARFFRISDGGSYDVIRAESASANTQLSRNQIEITRAAARMVDKGQQPSPEILRMLAADKNLAQYWKRQVLSFTLGRNDPVEKMIDSTGSRAVEERVRRKMEERGLR